MVLDESVFVAVGYAVNSVYASVAVLVVDTVVVLNAYFYAQAKSLRYMRLSHKPSYFDHRHCLSRQSHGNHDFWSTVDIDTSTLATKNTPLFRYIHVGAELPCKWSLGTLILLNCFPHTFDYFIF